MCLDNTHLVKYVFRYFRRAVLHSFKVNVIFVASCLDLHVSNRSSIAE